MNIHESAEDYLEKILMLQEQKGSVRSIDIAVAMGFSKPSVSVAMKNLRENGYISMDPDGFIKLEQPGMEIAQRIYGRHRKLTAFFVALGVDPDVAAKDACKVEHDLSEETYSKMIAFAEKAEKKRRSKFCPKIARWHQVPPGNFYFRYTAACSPARLSPLPGPRRAGPGQLGHGGQ